MKKILKIVAGVLVLLLLTVILIPVIFKGKLFNVAMEQANEQLNAEVALSDLDVSLIENFPDLTVTLSGISVKNKAPFEGITLAEVEEVKLSLDLMSVISGDQMTIHTLGVKGVNANVIVLEDGTANYDIAKADTTATEAVEEEASSEKSSAFDVSVKSYYFSNMNVSYIDKQGDMEAHLVNFSHEGNGDFTQDVFDLKTTTVADAITYKLEGVPYLNETKTDITFNIGIDLTQDKYTFNENVINLNALQLEFDGWVQLVGDDVDMDLTFNTRETSFKSLLSLIPVVYTHDFQDVETSGELALQGMAKGRFSSTETAMTLPAFDVGLLVKNARFNYPDMPSSCENIQLDVRAQNPGGSEDLTQIDVNEFHLELAENPVDFSLHLKTPISDPDFNAALAASIDLENIADVIPMEEGEAYKGVITADVETKGKLSDIEAERYDRVHAAGELIILGLDYQSSDLEYPVQVKNMYLKFNPKQVDLNSFVAQLGASDLSAKGSIDNLIGYYLNDEVLAGSFEVNSTYMNLNELMGEEESEPVTDTASTITDSTSESSGAVLIPQNIDFALTTNIKEIIYDSLSINNMVGKLSLNKGIARMDNLAMDLMQGSMRMSGNYNTTNELAPSFNFKMAINRFDVEETAVTFNTIEKMAPILKSAKGKFSTDLTIDGVMDGNMEPLMNTLNGGGSLQTHGVLVSHSVLQKVNDALRSSDYNPLELDDVNISYTFKDGRIETKPFEIKVGDSEATIYGHSTFEQTMDYTMEMEVPMSQLGNAAAGAVNSLLSQAKSAGVNTGDLGKSIKVKVKIEGAITDPKVRPVFGGSGAGSAQQQVKEVVKEAVNDAVNEGLEQAKVEAEKLKAEARKQGDKLVAEAEKQAAQIRKEAKNGAEQLRAEAKKQADDLVNKASNFLEKKAAEVAAKKINEEADKRAIQLEQEADKKATKLVETAKKKSDDLINKASEEGDKRIEAAKR